MRCARDADETMRPTSGEDSSAPAALCLGARVASRVDGGIRPTVAPAVAQQKHPRVCMPPVVPGRPQPRAHVDG